MDRRFIAMKRRNKRKKPKSKAVAARKAKIVTVLSPAQAGHSSEATAENKKAMLQALGMGMGPGPAANAVGIGRSTAFTWKKEDPEFSAKWDEARETAWDRLEDRAYELGMGGELKAITDTLKAFRPERWRETRSETTSTLNTNFNVRMTLEELQERLKQLGIVMPEYEGDQIEDHTIPLIEDHATDRDKDDPSRDR